MAGMRGVVITSPGDPEVLAIKDVTAPDPGPGELRVRVRAFGVNRADLLQRRRLYPPPPGWLAEAVTPRLPSLGARWGSWVRGSDVECRDGNVRPVLQGCKDRHSAERDGQRQGGVNAPNCHDRDRGHPCH